MNWIILRQKEGIITELYENVSMLSLFGFECLLPCQDMMKTNFVYLP